LCFQSFASAGQKSGMDNAKIASIFRSLAKAFIATADINQLKEQSINELRQMSEEKFRKEYAEVYRAIQGLPVHLKNRYRITAATTKAQVIQDIRSLNKNKVYELIDAVPDAVIAGEFMQYLNKKGNGQSSNTAGQINAFWDGTMEKVRK
jgi:hypothetical protein